MWENKNNEGNIYVFFNWFRLFMVIKVKLERAFSLRFKVLDFFEKLATLILAIVFSSYKPRIPLKLSI